MTFTFDTGDIALPQGAWARTQRRYLRNKGRLVLGLTQGDFRSYVFPLFTPAGHLVTSEAPADHPHHQSLWLGADHVHALVPASEGQAEEYTYNFYLNDVFQGRAPGCIVERACSFSIGADGAAVIRQELDWQGPAEWAAPAGRQILREERTYVIEQTAEATALRLRSTLRPGVWTVRLGPTRHAYFNARVGESMQMLAGGRALNEHGEAIGATQTPAAEWIDYVGPVGQGREAGVALMPLTDRDEGWWFVADWGVITWGPFRRRPRVLDAGSALTQEACVIAHDADIGPAQLRALRDRLAQRDAS
jgi:Methane oxygenase PmoA